MSAERAPAFEAIGDATAEVDGWLTVGQAERLHHAGATVRSGERIVEIGSFRGKSTIVWGLTAGDGVEIVAIDPHAGNDRGPQEIAGFEAEAATDHEVFLANLAAAGVADRVRYVRAFSHDAHAEVVGDIAVLYVDGAHRFSPARRDIAEWGARVQPAGTMLIHDAFSSVGVTLAILRELLWSRRYRYVGRTRSLAEFRADLDPTFGGRFANAGRIIAQLPWFVMNLGLKVALSARLGGLLKRITGRPVEWPY